MTGPLIETLSTATIVGSGVVGGVFFAFSTFVMAALGDVPAAEGMRAMQRINRTVLNAWFLGLFVGTAIAAVALLATVFLAAPGEGAWWPVAGAGLYAVGTFGVTLAFNVPRNEALAELDPEAPGSGAAWARYLEEWTMWNHVRTVAAIAAVGCLLAAR